MACEYALFAEIHRVLLTGAAIRVTDNAQLKHVMNAHNYFIKPVTELKNIPFPSYIAYADTANLVLLSEDEASDGSCPTINSLDTFTGIINKRGFCQSMISTTKGSKHE